MVEAVEVEVEEDEDDEDRGRQRGSRKREGLTEMVYMESEQEFLLTQKYRSQLFDHASMLPSHDQRRPFSVPMEDQDVPTAFATVLYEHS